MDVLSSGAPERPPRPGRVRRFRRPRVSRWVLVACGLVVAAAVAFGLRAGTGPVVPAVPDATPPPAVVGLPTGPFDRLPGRTPIPPPSSRDGRLSGEVPAPGGPGKEPALGAALLVLGRYCVRPDRYTLTVAPQDGWNTLGVLAVGLGRGGDGPLIDLQLTWTGRTYRWSGSLVQLRTC